jgi:hypothetical protein
MFSGLCVWPKGRKVWIHGFWSAAHSHRQTLRRCHADNTQPERKSQRRKKFLVFHNFPFPLAEEASSI